ncbi:hypothetical protein HCN44_006245 [Aphidius gifuensis]|uniref:Uncharacterized protein n=2 Tax=Aphidius gifuensis TaxID=684658 RepID=A0A835CUB9_APHGI|nr:hypothetical protein HCN44_006245 [Aphidius gifuensis]
MNKAYSSEQKEREEEEDGEEDLSENDRSIEETSLNIPKFSSTPTSKNKLRSSQLDPVFIDVNKVNNRSCNVDIGSKTDVDLEDQLKDAQDQVKYWKAKYKSLVLSQNYPLTEETGQKLVSLVNQLAANYEYETKPEDNGSGRKKGSTSSTSSKEKNHESISNNSGEKKSTSDSLSQSIYDSKVNSVFEKNFKDPAECAKSIVRSLWTTEELQQRVVRLIAGNDKKVLTPTKVDKGKTLFSVWLKDNGYIKAAKTKEMSRWNNHMSRAIESALKLKKKQLAVKKKSTENKENKDNAAKTQDDEKKKNIGEEETNSDN